MKSRSGLKQIIIDECVADFLYSLKERIEARGLTVLEFAKKCGVDPSDLKGIIKGAWSPLYPTLVKLANALDYDLSESFNYRYFNDLIDIERMKRTLKQNYISVEKLASQIGYTKMTTYKALAPNSKVRSVRIIHAIEQYITRNELEYDEMEEDY